MFSVKILCPWNDGVCGCEWAGNIQSQREMSMHESKNSLYHYASHHVAICRWLSTLSNLAANIQTRHHQKWATHLRKSISASAHSLPFWVNLRFWINRHTLLRPAYRKNTEYVGIVLNRTLVLLWIAYIPIYFCEMSVHLFCKEIYFMSRIALAHWYKRVISSHSNLQFVIICNWKNDWVLKSSLTSRRSL